MERFGTFMFATISWRFLNKDNMSIFDIDIKNKGITQEFLINNGWVPAEIDINENLIKFSDIGVVNNKTIWIKRIIETDNDPDFVFYKYEKVWWLGYNFSEKILYNLDNGVKFKDIENILDLETLIYSIKTNKISYE